MKWALVLTGVSDFYRPADKLSLTQNVALTATGAIWTRWCFIIKPKNMLLAAVNFFLGCVGSVQVFRILSYQRSVKNQPGAAAEIQSVAKDAKSEIEGAVQDPKSVVDRVAK
ncbi:MAG: Mitochondrial pyruvate carrier 2 [Thelocarpon superellum]|nr:MAG: Mitochondrial pyruvate carrier 2 [Thelocarpon superellum]